jgi:hypothetical protein
MRAGVTEECTRGVNDAPKRPARSLLDDSRLPMALDVEA